MFFSIFWTTYIPVAIVILSLVGDWVRHSFQEVRTSSIRTGGGSREGLRRNRPLGPSAEAKTFRKPENPPQSS
jgi:hypothetical protein